MNKLICINENYFFKRKKTSEAVLVIISIKYDEIKTNILSYIKIRETHLQG